MNVNDQNEVKDEKNPIATETELNEKVQTENSTTEKEVVSEAKPLEEEKTQPEESQSEIKEETENEVKEPEEKAEETIETTETEKPKPNGSDEDMMSLLDESFNKFKKGAIIEGTVVSVDEREILVDIGFKSEGSIPSKEFTNSQVPEIGEEIKVYIDSVEDASGRLKLSKKKADFYSNLERFKK
ncbi:MAG: hypothetical protein DRZ79_02675 [Candidatus Cloacimonadota bacterium]|nr:MAG: hypothetical protein DRZ79_02675 [Candidatus Cloacimonadota bacterium]